MFRQLHIHPDFNYYMLFYLIGFAFAYLVILLKILKLKENKALLFTVTALIFLSFVFGCKLIPSLELLLFPEKSSYVPDASSQMAFGGISLSLLVILGIRSIIKLPQGFWYSIGLALITGLIIQKPGCLLGGCCKGIEMSAGFGITYFDGLLRYPLQIYEVLLYILALGIICAIKIKKSDSRYFWIVSAYCFIQFGLEFLRASEDTIAFRFELLGLKAMQWNYLVLAVTSLYLGFNNEKRLRTGKEIINNTNPVLQVLLLLLVVLGFYLVHDQLFPSEIIAINLAFLPALSFTAVEVFRNITIPGYRWATVASLVLPMMLMAQTVKEYEQEQDVFKTIGAGYSRGSFDYYLSNSTDPGSCSGYTYSTDYSQEYSAITIGYAVTKVRDKGSFTYGFDGVYGQITEIDQRLNTTEKYTMGYVSPYINYDGKWIGIGVGAYFGNVYYPPSDALKSGSGYPESGLNQTPALPRFTFRVGPTSIFFAEYQFANHFPTALPAITHEFNIGSGFSSNNGFYIKYAVLFGSQSHETVGNYVKAYVPIDNKVVLEPMIGLGSMKNIYMFGLSYRFGHKVTTYVPLDSN